MSKKKQFAEMRDTMQQREAPNDDFAYDGQDLDDAVIEELRNLGKGGTKAIAQSFTTREIRTGAFLWTPIGLRADGAVSREDWEATGRLLQRLDASLQWLLGDWLVYGADLGYGDRASFASEIGLEVKTIYDYAYVASKVAISVRTENLSFTHHKLVASMEADEQAYWLKRAEAEKLSVAALRSAIQQRSLPPTTTENAFSDRENRRRMNRIWKAVEAGRWDKLKLHDLDALMKWIEALREKKRSS